MPENEGRAEGAISGTKSRRSEKEGEPKEDPKGEVIVLPEGRVSKRRSTRKRTRGGGEGESKSWIPVPDGLPEGALSAEREVLHLGGEGKSNPSKAKRREHSGKGSAVSALSAAAKGPHARKGRILKKRPTEREKK